MSISQGVPGSPGSLLRLGREAPALQHAGGQFQHEPLDPEHHSVSCENPGGPSPNLQPQRQLGLHPRPQYMSHVPWDFTPPHVLALCDRNLAPYMSLQVRNVTRDGGFGPWSPWKPCEHLDGDNSGSCLCRARSCDSPRPRCGGLECLGPSIHIANCSR